MGPTWGPSGADRTQVGPMLAPLTLLSGMLSLSVFSGNLSRILQPTSGEYPLQTANVGNGDAIIIIVICAHFGTINLQENHSRPNSC